MAITSGGDGRDGIGWVSDRQDVVDIHPQDNKNMAAIMAEIGNKKITDEAAIRALVDTYEFSSLEAKQHTAGGMIELLRKGAFGYPPINGVEIDMVNTDAPQPELRYPEGLDEGKIGKLLDAVIEAVDREKLFASEDISTHRHPLVLERIGKDVALNYVIRALIKIILAPLLSGHYTLPNSNYTTPNFDLTKPRSQYVMISDPSDIKRYEIEKASEHETILSCATKDSVQFESALKALKEAIWQLVILNPGIGMTHVVGDIIANQTERKMKMPSEAHLRITYWAAEMLREGEAKENVLAIIAQIKNAITGLDASQVHENTEWERELAEQLEEEFKAVRSWVERAVA